MSYLKTNNYFASDQWRDYRDEVKRRAYGNWDEILMTLAGEHLAASLGKIGHHGPCPRHGGKDGFRVYRDVRQTGGSVCNTCGANNDGFQTLHWLYGWGFSQSVRAVGDIVGVQHYQDNSAAPIKPKIALVPPPKAKSLEEVAREDEYKAKRQRETWEGSLALTHPESLPARLYMRNRAITSAVGPLDDLRFHPGLPYFENKVNIGTFPALLCLLRQPCGKPTTIQRIFITEDGLKAPVEHPKKVMPYRSSVHYAGSAVRLDHAVGSVLCVTEGVETGLAWRAMTGLPTWSTCVAGLMEELVIPDCVQVLIACGDRDRSIRGETAASTLVERVKASGRKAAVFMPPYDIPESAEKGIDWADILERFQLEEAQKQPFAIGVREQTATLLETLGLTWESANAHY